MSAPKSQSGWILLCGVLFVGAIIVGAILVDLPQVQLVCTGPITDTDLCESARARHAIFGAVLTGSGVVALAIIAAAWALLAKPARRDEPEVQ